MYITSLDMHWMNLKMGVIGDSITAGTYTPKGGSSPNAVTNEPYWKIAAFLLGMDSIGYGINGTSISKTTTSGNNAMSIRYASMDNDLDLIIVAGGTNDYGTNVKLGTINDLTDVSFYGALNVLCDGLIKKYVGKRIVFMTPLLRNYHDQGEGANTNGNTLEDFRKAIYDVARDRYGLMVIDSKTLGVSPFSSIMRADYIVDGCHPNPSGHKIIGKNLAYQLLSC